MKRLFAVSITLLMMGLMAVFPQSPALQAQDKSDSKEVEKKSDTKKTETVEIKLEPMEIYESFDGVFESTRVAEVKTDLKTWTDLKIKNVMDEGSPTTDGQQLLAFDTESIDKAVAEAEFAVANSKFSLETARLEMEEANATFELDKSSAERAWKNAQQDYEYYQKVQLPQRLDDIDYSEKSAGYFLEYSKDELDQLQQMYTEDELTEESEAIVLKRAERSVESAQRSRDRTMQRVKRDREVNVSREKIAKEEALKRSEVAHKRSNITLPIKKEKAAIAYAQAEFNHKEKLKRLEELRADQKKMNLTAPMTGVVYHGRCVRGKWSGARGASARRLERNKKVTADTVVMTIVDASRMMIRADLTQEQLGAMAPRMEGRAKSMSSSRETFPVTVKSVSPIPLDAGKYDCQITPENVPAGTMPGMRCTMSFKVYENDQALVAPKASVFSDDNGISHYVYVMKNDKPRKQAVSVGYVSGTMIEITDGLSAGDKIAKSKP